jgi:hypothetical protein
MRIEKIYNADENDLNLEKHSGHWPGMKIVEIYLYL